MKLPSAICLPARLLHGAPPPAGVASSRCSGRLFSLDLRVGHQDRILVVAGCAFEVIPLSAKRAKHGVVAHPDDLRFFGAERAGPGRLRLRRGQRLLQRRKALFEVLDAFGHRREFLPNRNVVEDLENV